MYFLNLLRFIDLNIQGKGLGSHARALQYPGISSLESPRIGWEELGMGLETQGLG